MIIDDLLTSAGFVRNKTYKETRFLKVPNSAFATYSDQLETEGSDLMTFYCRHLWTVSIYTYDLDKTMLEAFETALNSRGIKFTRYDRTWMTDDQWFITMYNLETVEKI